MENNIKRESRLFFSYQINPDIKFETYEEGERVILLMRAHPFTQLGWIMNTIILIILTIFINFFLPQFLSLNKIFVFNCFAIVFIASFAFYYFLHWYFNVGILTNKRLVDIDFSGILYREITTARINNIEDITIKGSGFFGSLFDYGSIYIQTAGMENYIEFNDVPYPSKIVDQINKLLSKKHVE
ncbi:MAG: hypothetical protein KatS3mg092_0212 [Patescibacteria group bacterium]|nr:MAG: hypothetical protein KatS3mg092_0212 [Patescibacteria group bacterium]